MATTREWKQRTQRRDRDLRRQRSLRSVIESISGELELRPLLTRIVEQACTLLDADHGTIGLVDEARRVVRTEAGFNMPPNELGTELGLGEGIAGLVLEARRPLVFGRYGDVPRPTQPGMLNDAILGMPIEWRGTMIGFFGIGRSPKPSTSPRSGAARLKAKRFTKADVAALTEFARHAALAIRNARAYELEQQRTERLRIITRIGGIITSDLRLGDLLKKAADAVHELLGYPNVAIALIDPADPRTLVLDTLGGHYRSIIHGEYRFPIDQGIMGAAARARQTVVVNDVRNDPRYLQTPGGPDVYAEVAVPILFGDSVLGVLNVETDEPLAESDAELLQLVADQMGVAISNARLHAVARELAANEERNRLARELHDSVTQLLFSVTLIAQSLGAAWRRDPAEGERRVERLLQLSQTALAEMRALLNELRYADVGDDAAAASVARAAAVLGRHGLVGALRRRVRDLAADGLSVTLHTRGYVPLPKDQEFELFRIAQEALHNVAKHASARTVDVSVTSTADGTVLRVRDDGAGFDAGAGGRLTRPRTGHGLRTMRERADTLGGRFCIESAPGQGTTVEITVPAGYVTSRNVSNDARSEL
ncbi:MAG TPA: GAF domain-containing sensor histidine kinase [Gemmatimonadaceae bacterium]|nr:GAF domain-containing sensor histidine kinase [Gemmatimonadaceae bacterium]